MARHRQADFKWAFGTAKDPVGSTSQVTLTIPFEASQRLVEVAQVPGLILDATADRILWTDSTGAEHRVAIRDRASGADAIIFRTARPIADRGFLTPSGSLFFTLESPGRTDLYEWRGGTAVNLRSVNPPQLRVAGRFAVWPTSTDLVRRDLAAGTTDVIADIPVQGDVAPNGDVAYSGQSGIVRVRDGVSTPITTSPAGSLDSEPRTDGTNVVFKRTFPASGTDSREFILLNDGSGESVLSGPFQVGTGLRSYLTADGWIAYAKQSSTFDQLWVRAPTGENVQATAVNQFAWLEELAPNGSFFFEGSNGRRYLAVSPFTTLATEVSTTVGRGLFIEGQPFVVVGRSLFGVN